MSRRLKLTVGDPEPGDDGPLICLDATIPLARPENVTAACSDCGRAIQVHPSSPAVKRRICLSCAEPLLLTPGVVTGARITRAQLDFVRLVRWPGGTKQ